MELLLLSIILIYSTQQACTVDSQCPSCCDTIRQRCDNCYCQVSADCGSKCCIGGLCKHQKYCLSCSSHVDCESKCCLQGNCNSNNQCPYLPIGMDCAFDYQCSSYQCVSNTCVDNINNSCTNHTHCSTKCCYIGKCQFRTLALCPALQINMTCNNNWDCDTYLCQGHRCKALLTGRCYLHEDCESGCCVNSRCSSLNDCSMTPARSPCLYDYECTSNKCLNSKCLSRIGEACFNHTECEYKCCINEICSFGCKYLKIGAYCLAHYDCQSYICKSRVCVGEFGAICNNHKQCKSGFCMNEVCSSDFEYQSNLRSGDSCLHNYECQSYLCDINETCVALSGVSCQKHYECVSTNCCIDSKCTNELITECNIAPIGSACRYNWECTSNICSNNFCKGSVGDSNSNINHINCASMCSINSTCQDSSNCIHKNAGEICLMDSECITNYCNGVCLSALNDLCLTHQYCITTKDIQLSCQNHICKEVNVNKFECEVNEDCLYIDDGVLTNFTCQYGKCGAPIGNSFQPESCTTKCNSNGYCELYSYCVKNIGERCTTHKDCNSHLCKIESGKIGTCTDYQPTFANGNTCVSNYSCESFYCNSSTNTCDNRPCSYHQECMIGCCKNGVCAEKCNLLPIFSSCTTNYQCSSNLCSGVCKLGLWYPCTEFNECQSGCCSDGICQLNTTEKCPFKSSLDKCQQSYECKINDCSDKLKICKAQIYEACINHEYCHSGCCGSNLICQDAGYSDDCQLNEVGFECNANYQCKSFICDSNICKLNLKESCNSHSECLSHYCSGDFICDEGSTALLKGGSQCSMNLQCESYACINNVCKGLDGSTCVRHTDCFSGCCGIDCVCISDANITDCSFYEVEHICNTSYQCQSNICESNYCKRNLNDSCYGHNECISRYCGKNLICQEMEQYLLIGGSECENGSQCESFACSMYEHICIAYNGFACNKHEGCFSGCCDLKGKCASNLKNEICTHLTINSRCSHNFECSSYNCFNNLCKLPNGERCFNHNQCASGYCNRYDGICKVSPYGSQSSQYNDSEYCMHHRSCKSGCCYNGEVCKPFGMCFQRSYIGICGQNSICNDSEINECVDGYCYSKLWTYKCANDFECKSYNCANGYCSNGSVCDTSCEPNCCYCTDQYCIPKYDLLQPCYSNSDCKSNNCSSVGNICSEYINAPNNRTNNTANAAMHLAYDGLLLWIALMM